MAKPPPAGFCVPTVASAWDRLDRIVLGTGAVVTLISLIGGDLRTAAAATVVCAGLVAYRRGWIRRDGPPIDGRS